MEKKYTLGLEDLVSNLFIVLMENDCSVNEISYNQIIEFGKIINEEALKNDMKVALDIGRDQTQKFLKYYSKTFTEVKIDDGERIRLNDGVTPIHLIYDFRGYLPIDLLLLIEDVNVANKTLSMMGYTKLDKKKQFNTKEYIDELEKMIKEKASNMEFAKCMEIREKLYSLKAIDNRINRSTLDDKPKVKTKRNIVGE